MSLTLKSELTFAFWVWRRGRWSLLGSSSLVTKRHSYPVWGGASHRRWRVVLVSLSHPLCWVSTLGGAVCIFVFVSSNRSRSLSVKCVWFSQSCRSCVSSNIWMVGISEHFITNIQKIIIYWIRYFAPASIKILWNDFLFSLAVGGHRYFFCVCACGSFAWHWRHLLCELRAERQKNLWRPLDCTSHLQIPNTPVTQQSF